MDEPLELRRKRLIHRSLYTGTKETDLLLGSFARRYLPSFTLGQLERYERLLAAPDPDIFRWVTGQAPIPARYRTDVMDLLRNFKNET